jgi:hypothetical protein
MHHCPNCYSEQIRRSKRRGVIEQTLLTVVALKPYRCLDCYGRFYRWPVRMKSQQIANGGTLTTARSGLADLTRYLKIKSM